MSGKRAATAAIQSTFEWPVWAVLAFELPQVTGLGREKQGTGIRFLAPNCQKTLVFVASPRMYNQPHELEFDIV